MAKVAWLFLLICLGRIPALAQGSIQIEASAHGGVPLYDSLRSAFCCTTAAAFITNEPDDSKYVAGFSAGVMIHDRIHVSFGAMYMPVAFVTRGTTCCPISHPEFTTHGTSWDFPLLADYRWLKGSVRPFSGGGLIILSRTSQGPDQTPAPVVSGGVEWVHQAFVIRPEVRYIHYKDQSASDVAVQRPPHQVQVLLGFTFRK